MENKRNGKIELLRFVFALIVVIFHINADFWNKERFYLNGKLSLARMGGVGVEFFFIVSGFLFAASVNRIVNANSELDIAKEDVGFIWKKIKAILPYHLIACSFAFVFALARALTGDKGIEILIDKIPSLFLLQAFRLPGSSESFLGAEWYISTMIVVMFILFPVMAKLKNVFTGIIAPVLGLALLGYNAGVNGKLIGTNRNIRGLQDICLGIGCYYVFSVLSNKELSSGCKRTLKIVEPLCYAMVIIYCFSTMHAKYQIYTALLLCVAVTLTFSEHGIPTGWFNNRVCRLLGKWSIPIYLMQNPVRSGMQFVKEKGLTGASDSVLAIMDFVLIVAAGIIVYYAYGFAKRVFLKKRFVHAKH